MDGNNILFFLACLIGSITCRPLQASPTVLSTSAAKDPYNIFSIIIEANKDIMVPVQQGDVLIQTGRSATTCTACLWPKSADGTVPVPYIFSSAYSASHLKLFTTSMQEFETLTCVRFKPRKTEKDYINIVSSYGCTSFMGRIGGAQMVGLDKTSCMSRGIIQHELDHVLGFYHEHTRTDRDNYVTIMQQYISPGYMVNFLKQVTNNLGLPYDYGSVMHYDKYAFSNTSNQPTIVTKPIPNVPIGQRYGLSALDVAKINKLYQCNVCANLLNAEKGTMVSPNYPSNYYNNASCVWLIRTPSGQVTLQFNAFNIQSTPACSSDYIKIYDGPTITYPVLLDKTCGASHIPFIVASTDQMLVEFVSDSSVTGAGFKATYGSVPCGGNFFAFHQNFTSPGYPVAYPPNLDCTYNITAPVGYQILLTINDFQLQNSIFCMYDYMEVQDGPNIYGPFCGNYDIVPITSTGNSLTVTFYSDSIIQMRGFQASYIFIIPPTTASYEQNFTSPGYPVVYPPNMDYTFNITAPFQY